MNKIAVLVSGGLDSTIGYHVAVREVGKANVKAIHVDLGHPYAEKEKEALDKLGINSTYVTCDIFGTLFDFKEDGWIIPGRNLILSSLAALSAPVVYLMALGTDMNNPRQTTRDTSKKFFEDSTNLISFVMSNFPDRKETIVTSPFKNITKTEMVSLAINGLGLSEEYLKKTSSCYNPHKINCGECGACNARWMAMINNNIFEEYETTPWNSKHGIDYLSEVSTQLKNNDYSLRSKQRVLEILEAYKKVGMYHE
jgi:7-cyano-7-deazaguanine synthase in queuosine biosynthesis